MLVHLTGSQISPVKLLVTRILRLAEEHPTVQIKVYCGHGHWAGYVQMADNIEVFTGRAEYGSPSLAGQIHYS